MTENRKSLVKFLVEAEIAIVLIIATIITIKIQPFYGMILFMMDLFVASLGLCIYNTNECDDSEDESQQ